MLKITRQADYGIVLMTRLAAEPESWFNAPELAEETSLPAPTVSKILKLLARSGLLDSQRGVKGGYSLACLPDEISVAQIITALDGPIAITECIDGTPGACSKEPICPVRGNWQRINGAIRGALEGITLAEMTASADTLLVTLGSGGEPPSSANTL